MPDQPTLSRMLLEAYRALEAETQRALADRGIEELRPSYAWMLSLVDRGGSRLSELARRAGVTRQATMQAVDDLSTLGYVRRTPDEVDGRAKIVRLTARGRRQRAEARRALAAVEGRSRRVLGDRRYEALRITLEDLVAPEE
jgi:DNA-binding MarR family transcriptional regulator